MDSYGKLSEILHKHPTVAPKSKSFDEILRILFTPEEIEVALCMVFVHMSIQKITKVAGVSEDEVLIVVISIMNLPVSNAKIADMSIF